MTADDSHNAHHAGHDEPHGGGHDAEGHGKAPSTVEWEDPAFDTMTNFTLLGCFLGRLLDKGESEKRINNILDE